MTTPTPDDPATVDAVAGWLGIPESAAGTVERAHIATAVKAVNAQIREWHPTPEVLPESIVHGAVMLAARVTRRRNSPAGVEVMGDMGATYVARYDVDLDRFLQIGAYRRPMVG